MPVPTDQETLDAAKQARYDLITGKIKHCQINNQTYTLNTLSELQQVIDLLENLVSRASSGAFQVGTYRGAT